MFSLVKQSKREEEAADMETLQGRKAVVTGAGVGIGQAIAVELARQGASVIVHYPPHEDNADETLSQIEAVNGKAHAVVGDLQDVDRCHQVVDEAAALLGGLNVLVNNSGITWAGPFVDTSPERFAELFAVNVGSHFHCAQRALTHFTYQEPARVINIGSFHSQRGFPGYVAYATTKGAVEAFTRTLAIELASTPVRVNSVAPGAVEVPRYFDIPGYTTEQGDRMVAVGRIGRPRDIAGAVSFLASDAADWVTGQTIFVDGGTCARMGLWWEEASG